MSKLKVWREYGETFIMEGGQIYAQVFQSGDKHASHFAAAPDLLEALENMLDGISPDCQCLGCQQARAAIKKAKREEG